MNTAPATAQEYGLRTAVHTEEFETVEFETEHLESLGTVRIVPLSPEGDLDLIHGWVTQDRARFWGMTEYSRSDVLEVYQFLESLATHHAFLVLLAGEPVALFQTYEPLQDPVGEAYPARAQDIGMHLLLAPATRPIPNFTPRLVTMLINFMFSNPAIDRIVVEPDARNDKAVRRLEATCFELGPQIQLAQKEAQLAFLTRERFARTKALRTR